MSTNTREPDHQESIPSKHAAELGREAEAVKAPPVVDAHEEKPERELASSRSIKNARVRKAFDDLPSITEPEWRVACADISQVLGSSLIFKLGVGIPIFAFLLVIFGLFGWGTRKDVLDEVQRFKADSVVRISVADSEVKSLIAQTFKEERFQKIVRVTAAEKSAELLSGSIQPSIEEFNRKVVEKLGAFEASLEAKEAISQKDLLDVREALRRLQRRNEILALADRAAGGDELYAYKKLETAAYDPKSDEEERSVALAELKRVFALFGANAPSTIESVKLDPKLFNPFKKSEDELTSDDLLNRLPYEPDPVLKARIAFLITKRLPDRSAEAASELVMEMKKEKNLQVLRFLRNAFTRATGQVISGKLDGSGEIAWWTENEQNFGAELHGRR